MDNPDLSDDVLKAALLLALAAPALAVEVGAEEVKVKANSNVNSRAAAIKQASQSTTAVDAKPKIHTPIACTVDVSGPRPKPAPGPVAGPVHMHVVTCTVKPKLKPEQILYPAQRPPAKPELTPLQKRLTDSKDTKQSK